MNISKELTMVNCCAQRRITVFMKRLSTPAERGNARIGSARRTSLKRWKRLAMCTALTLRSWFPNWRQLLVDQVPVLDARLSAAAAFCAAGQHGSGYWLRSWKTVSLSGGGKNCQVIAADIRPAPLARARETMLRYGCAQRGVQIGRRPLRAFGGEVQTVVIAGVSGITACDIVEACPFSLEIGTRFIFVPPTKKTCAFARLALGARLFVDRRDTGAGSRTGLYSDVLGVYG